MGVSVLKSGDYFLNMEPHALHFFSRASDQLPFVRGVTVQEIFMSKSHLSWLISIVFAKNYTQFDYLTSLNRVKQM